MRKSRALTLLREAGYYVTHTGIDPFPWTVRHVEQYWRGGRFGTLQEAVEYFGLK